MKLAAPIPGADPYPFFAAKNEAALVGENLIVVTAFAPSLKSDPAVPLVQACTVRAAERRGDAVAVSTDCDAEAVASGSLMLVRMGGKLHVVAILSGSGKKGLDGVDFDVAAGSFTSGVAIAGDFEAALGALSTEAPVPPGSAYAP